MDFFQRTLRDPEERLNIQPAFIYSALAMATLMKSSDIEYGPQGRNRAMELRQSAQEELELAMHSDWIDASLAEAALVRLHFVPILTDLPTLLYILRSLRFSRPPCTLSIALSV
jgi:hypothetical protein